ncbi:ferrous iron transporter C [Enterobacteriaceae bacterium 4M9]|nr:ferrous iron transporter C [Enterobacteriaceae bacterium 4M9]
MAGLKEIREMLALRGRLASAQISQLLGLPQPRVEALLAHLEHMGQAVRVAPDTDDGCLSGSCRRCTERSGCQPEQWALASAPGVSSAADVKR